jgi:DNA-binding transcriptional ArsR family regulator
VLELEFTARDLAYTRFAFSPLWEVIAAVRVLRGDGHPVHEPWAAPVRERLARSSLDWRLLADLVPVPTRVIPGFVAPPPTTPVPDLATELATLRATPDEVVLRELDTIPEIRTAHTRILRDPPAGLARLCEVIEEFWSLALEPWWPRILTLLQGDVIYRARRLATGGASALFADLEPKVRWAGAVPAGGVERLRVAHLHVSGRRGLRGQGLLLVPSVFVWPRIFSITVPGWQPTLRYPPRGIATLWERRSGAPAALAGVLGASRAALLGELDTPASTTDLARRTGLAAGGVSAHLGALRAAGLVSAHRTGRFVLYARTATGEALLTAQT